MENDHLGLESYLTSNSIVQQQVESYNRFIRMGINKVLESNNLVEPEVTNFAIKFTGIRLEKPMIIESTAPLRR